MKKVFVFCIGGTGIRVMKSIIMLMAGGMKTNNYSIIPVIIDPHLDLDEKKNLHSLIDNYKAIHENSVTNGTATLNALDGFFSSKLSNLNDLNGDNNSTAQVVGSDKKFSDYINLQSLSTKDVNQYLISTLFSTKSLNNNLSVGFKGNPNMGTVVLGDMIEGSDWFSSFKSLCEQGDRVFIISSIFGGTGASGYPLVEKKIKMEQDKPAVKNALMGAVTVLPYYGLKDPALSGSDIDSANFYTKTKAALAYYEGTVSSDYLYYVGEKSLKQVYDNDEKKQDDKANFIELVAASALFDFLKREKPDNRMYLSRAIESDEDSLDLLSLGKGYKDIVKCVADMMLLKTFVDFIPSEKYFPLVINRGFDKELYDSEGFKALIRFTEVFNNWYSELAHNKRSFSPLHYDDLKNMSGWIKGTSLEAKDISYYLVEMIKSSNKHSKEDHSNKFRFFLQFAYEAINNYTKKLF